MSEPEVLVVRVSGRLAAVTLDHVVETYRPLPVEPLSGAPRFVRGVALVRGVAVPVVDLGALLTGALPAERRGRCLTLRIGERHVALEVDDIVGVRALTETTFSGAPPLLQDAASASLQALATLDGELLSVLDAGRLLPESVPA